MQISGKAHPKTSPESKNTGFYQGDYDPASAHLPERECGGREVFAGAPGAEQRDGTIIHHRCGVSSLIHLYSHQQLSSPVAHLHTPLVFLTLLRRLLTNCLFTSEAPACAPAPTMPK